MIVSKGKEKVPGNKPGTTAPCRSISGFVVTGSALARPHEALIGAPRMRGEYLVLQYASRNHRQRSPRKWYYEDVLRTVKCERSDLGNGDYRWEPVSSRSVKY